MKKHFSALARPLGLAAGLTLASLAAAYAQAPGSTGPTPQGPDPTAVPLDGGASLLLAAGVGLGLRRLRRRPSSPDA